MRDRLLVGAFRLAWEWLPRVPEPIARRLFALLADLAWIRNGRGVRQLQRNLARVTSREFEDARDLARQGLRSYADYWRVLFQSGSWDDDHRNAMVAWHYRERIETARALGRGVILVASHSGNWDLAGSVVAPALGGITTVAERLKPEALFDMFVAHRVGYGLEILPHRGGDRPAIEVLQERLRAGGIVALVSDRDLSRRGVEVSFFDSRARMAAGPASLAIATGAAIVPCAVWTERGHAHILAHYPLDYDATGPDAVVRITQQIADVFARDIAAHPTEWHMLQPVFVDDVDRR